MAFSGLTVSITLLELRQTVRAMRDDAGFLVQCDHCGASRYIPAATASAANEFERLHKYCHLRGRR